MEILRERLLLLKAYSLRYQQTFWYANLSIMIGAECAFVLSEALCSFDRLIN